MKPVANDQIYAAWHGAGVDIAGGNWERFIGMVPALYTDDQLKAARVEVLRKALQKIEGLTYKEECEAVIRMMLTDELEKEQSK